MQKLHDSMEHNTRERLRLRSASTGGIQLSRVQTSTGLTFHSVTVHVQTTRSSLVAERPRDASCHWMFR